MRCVDMFVTLVGMSISTKLWLKPVSNTRSLKVPLQIGTIVGKTAFKANCGQVTRSGVMLCGIFHFENHSESSKIITTLKQKKRVNVYLFHSDVLRLLTELVKLT